MSNKLAVSLGGNWKRAAQYASVDHLHQPINYYIIMTNKTIIERGASWTYEETKLLLILWGQDLVQRQETKSKRTKEVYEKISEKFNQNGFERTADQVRTRVFNMIAEYRRILKDNNNPERKRKCIFYEALDKIYQAKHMDDLKNALDDFEPAEFPYSPQVSERGDGDLISDGEATDCNESLSNNNNNSSSNNNNRPSKNSNNATATPVNSGTTSTSKGPKYVELKDDTDDEYTTNASTTAGESVSYTPGENNVNSRLTKRMKLEQSPNTTAQNLPNPNHKTSASNASTSSSTNSSTQADQQNQSTSLTNSTNAKQNQNSSPTSSVVTTLAGGLSSQASSAIPSTSSTSHRHQSLLLPHASTSTSSASTPINKLTTAGSNNNTPSYININSTKLPIIRTNQLIGHPNGNESISLNGTATRLPTTAAITSHQLYQAPVNTFDVTSSALLIDRMFAHLSRESENMREWIALEKERLALERARRQQEAERELRRERVLIDTLMRFQEQWLSFITRLDPRIVENIKEPAPEFKVPPKEGSQSQFNLQTGNAHSSNDNVSQAATTQNNTTTLTYSNLSNEAGKS